MVPTTPGGEVIGIRYREASGVVDNVIIQNIGNMDGSAVGIGFYNQSPVVDNGQPPEETSVALSHSTIRNVVGNLILDPAEAGIALVNGLLLGSGPGSNTIQGNSIFTDVTVPIAPLSIDGRDNVISQNTIFAGPDSEIVDATTGSGTSSTANTYDNNRCFGGIPSDQFCR